MDTASASLKVKSGVFTPTAERNCLIVQSVLTLAVVLLTIKLGKVLVEFYWDNPGSACRLLRHSWLPRLIIATIGVYIVGRRFWPRWKWIALAGPFLLLIPAKLIQAWLHHSPSLAYEWLPEVDGQLWALASLITDLFGRDVVFLAVFAALVYIAANVTPSRYFRVLGLGVQCCVVLLLLVSSIELASYCKLGVAGSGHLLAFFLTNAASLWPMLRPELDVVSIAALLAPLAAGLATMLLVSRAYSQPGEKPPRQLARSWPVVTVLFLGASFVRPPYVDHLFDRYLDNTYLALGDILPWHRVAQLEAVKQADHMPPMFETAAATLEVQKDAPVSRKNVIIIMLESTRLGATSLGNPSLGTTPFLADFAAHNTVVPDMHAVIPRTSAAWVSVLNGVWPGTDEEMADWTNRGKATSLPLLLSTRGYSSAYITSAHLTFNYDAALIKKEHFGTVLDADSLPSQGFEHPNVWGYEDRIMVQPSLNWVKQQQEQKNPFLLVMMTTTGHYDYRYPSTWKTHDFGFRDQSYDRYLNCISYTDAMLKEFFDGLDKLGVLRSSIVIIMGDHGESFAEHGATAHSLDLYDETLKIPTIIHDDGVLAAGTSISGLREEVDVFPTVLDALGLTTTNATFSGTSLLKPVPPDRTLYYSGALYSQATAMQKGTTKYIYNFGRIPTEVYAIDQDPTEQHDIASTLPRLAIDKAEMELLVWRERVSRAYGAHPGSK